MKKQIILMLVWFIQYNVFSQTCLCGGVETTAINKYYPDFSGGCINPTVLWTGNSKFDKFPGSLLTNPPIAIIDQTLTFCYNVESSSQVNNYSVIAGFYFADFWNNKNNLGSKITSLALSSSTTVNVETSGFVTGLTATFGSGSTTGLIPAPYCAELFWVAYAGATGYLETSNTNSLKKGIGYYLAQSFILQEADEIGNVNATKGNYYVGNSVVFNSECSDNDFNDKNLASLFLTIETKFDKEKLYKIAKNFVNSNGNIPYSSLKILAEDLYERCKIIKNDVNDGIDLDQSELCQLSSAIRSYFTAGSCGAPNLPLMEDYWIRNNGFDDGTEPNWGGNPWESPDIINYIDGVPADPKTGVVNTMHVNIKNIGQGNCDKQYLKLYYSANLGNQNWSPDWTTPPFSGQWGSTIALPDIQSGTTYTATIDFTPPKEILGGKEEVHMCIYARIVDANDVSKSIIHSNPEWEGDWSTAWNVAYFNGIAWRNMTLHKGQNIVSNDLFFFKGATGVTTPNTIYPGVQTGPYIVDFDVNVVPQDDGNTNPNPPTVTEPNRDPDFFNKVDVILIPDAAMANAIALCDGQCITPGTYTLAEGGYKVTSSNFRFTNLNFEGNKFYGLYVKTIPKPGYRKCSFSLIQKNFDGKVFGGETYCRLTAANQISTPRERISIEKIQVNPNPSNGKFTIKIADIRNLSSIAVVNINGVQIKSIDAIENTDTYEVDISNEKAGEFIITAYYIDGTKSSEKIIKK